MPNAANHRPAPAAPANPPLVGRYPWIVAVALLALAPNIVLTTGFSLLQKPITLAFLAVGIAAVAALFVASGVRLYSPDLEAWLEHDEQARESLPTAQRISEAFRA